MTLFSSHHHGVLKCLCYTKSVAVTCIIAIAYSCCTTAVVTAKHNPSPITKFVDRRSKSNVHRNNVIHLPTSAFVTNNLWKISSSYYEQRRKNHAGSPMVVNLASWSSPPNRLSSLSSLSRSKFQRQAKETKIDPENSDDDTSQNDSNDAIFSSSNSMYSSFKGIRDNNGIQQNISTVANGSRSSDSGTVVAVNGDNGSETSTPLQPQQFTWDRVQKQMKLLWEMSLPYYRESLDARWLLGGVLVLTLANSGISVLFSYTGKDFWNALSAKDVDEFYNVLWKYVVALSIGAPITTLYKYQREQLAVHWREWMTDRTFQLYNTNQVYYRLERLPVQATTITSTTSPTSTTTNSEDSHITPLSAATSTVTIDNPDQRITEDVKTFTSFSLQLVITLLTSVIDLVAFSTILWSIYPQLFVAVIVYAAIGTIVTAVLGKSLIQLNFQQLKYEADLRYLLVRIRDNAESIAFYSGEDIEGRAVTQRSGTVMNNRRTINAAHRNLEFFTNSYRYFIQILPVAVVAPRYFAGEIGLGVISQSAGAFNHILSDLSILINQFEQLSAFSAGIERLSDFYVAMKYADIDRFNADTPLLQARDSVNMTIMNSIDVPGDDLLTATASIPAKTVETGLIQLKRWSPLSIDDTYRQQKHQQKDSLILKIENLDLNTPVGGGERTLIRQLSINITAGEHLLIVGDSGTGKSSLLRAIAGLWTSGNGTIYRPADEDVYFLPQRPYCTIGSLKDQLLYPSIERPATEVLSTNSTANANADNGESYQRHNHHHHALKYTLSDDDLLDVLDQVDLLHVAIRSGGPLNDPYQGLYSVQDWSNQLSLGEQQRLAFGRLLVNRPALVILDEATSALDIANEAKMYTLLKNMAQKTLSGDGKLSPPGLTYVSVGHRPSLIAFHDKKLRLSGKQMHRIEAIEKSSVQLQLLERSSYL